MFLTNTGRSYGISITDGLLFNSPDTSAITWSSGCRKYKSLIVMTLKHDSTSKIQCKFPEISEVISQRIHIYCFITNELSFEVV